ncbi:hypothetical protein TREMEDRAFT_29601 [Tremella mesenterica DSM 1558]|uniref:uncharacterized protein n=1 Tax=Tremella mesenterica (strain ATCC 24925 / CBS 8224 / DSM 1558 / NBRC 9311 / NRRL Y-6157 / RJB 2259-6 / UBC 559-6) TaxID=578456 RepID=UPI0003F48C58|nr:uncharacterized protein TREMEDRAFT_29601 [Tremella mesenterica DSM 1558]EIW69895.1 hypothetical protein TREMEDRAFT_29601 [Tremella mesenterica DSM 1558]
MVSDAERLAQWRTIGSRHSEEVIEIAPRVLARSTDQEWAVREQLVIAALDVGRIELASEQIDILEKKFPASPRVLLLKGLRLEAEDQPVAAKKVYMAVLATDETNVTAHQRLIAVSLSTTDVPTTIPVLLTYLDNFYSDPSAWSLLADLYCRVQMYAQALTAMGHLMLLQSWDSNAVTKAGEIAYTMKDYSLSLKYFLRAVEMENGPRGSAPSERTKAWWGVKQVRKLLEEGETLTTVVPDSMSTTPDQLKALDLLATERLLAIGGNDMESRRKILGEEIIVR